MKLKVTKKLTVKLSGTVPNYHVSIGGHYLVLLEDIIQLISIGGH